MLSKLVFTFKNNSNKLNYTISSCMHGMIMEAISSKDAEHLHNLSINPYSQNIFFDKEYMYWTINGLNEYAYNNILMPLMNIDNFYIKNIDISLELVKKTIEIYDLDDLFMKSIQENHNRFVEIKFNTTTAFKSQGEYIFFPDFSLILKSIMTKHDSVSEYKIDGEEILEHFIENIEIRDYNLRTKRFKVNNIYIPGFIGCIKIYIKGPKQLVSLFHYLVDFSEFSGIGIKSSLGMGSIKKERRNNG